MESDGRRRLRKLHCMKCGAPLTTRVSEVPLHHIPRSQLQTAQRQHIRNVCSQADCNWQYYDNPIPVVAAIIELVPASSAAVISASATASSPAVTVASAASVPSSAATAAATATAAASSVAGGEIVLVRGKGWPAGWFGLCTGFLEKGEHPTEAVLREVQEELGLEGELVSFIGVYPFPRMNQLIFAYHVRVQRDENFKVTVQEEEIEEYKLVAIEKLRPWSEGKSTVNRGVRTACAPVMIAN